MPAWPVTLHATTPAGEVLDLGALRRRDQHVSGGPCARSTAGGWGWEATAPEGRAQ